jgi:hypothetical protein
MTGESLTSLIGNTSLLISTTKKVVDTTRKAIAVSKKVGKALKYFIEIARFLPLPGFWIPPNPAKSRQSLEGSSPGTYF